LVRESEPATARYRSGITHFLTMLDARHCLAQPRRELAGSEAELATAAGIRRKIGISGYRDPGDIQVANIPYSKR